MPDFLKFIRGLGAAVGKERQRWPNNSPDRHAANNDNIDDMESIAVDLESPISRLFITGTGDVGKTTLIGSLKMLCLRSPQLYKYYGSDWRRTTPFSQPYCASKKQRVLQNVYGIIGTLIVQARSQFRFTFDSAEHVLYAHEIMNAIGGWDRVPELPQKTDLSLTEALAELIVQLWTEDSAIQRTYARRREIPSLGPNVEYFMRLDKLREIAHPDYVPSGEDILWIGDTTTHVNEHHFTIRNVRFTIHDCGGQPVERVRQMTTYIPNWLRGKRPQDSNYILYVASLAEYNLNRRTHWSSSSTTSDSTSATSISSSDGRVDMTSGPANNNINNNTVSDSLEVSRSNGPQHTGLQESIAYLKILLRMDEELSRTPFILFLNMRDMFEQKLAQYNDFFTYFPPDEYHHRRKQRSQTHRLSSKPPKNHRRRISVENAERIVTEKFLEEIESSTLNGSGGGGKNVYVKCTTAVDPMLMETIFSALQHELSTAAVKAGDEPYC